VNSVAAASIELDIEIIVITPQSKNQIRSPATAATPVKSAAVKPAGTRAMGTAKA
jgi:hypothetical protein